VLAILELRKVHQVYDCDFNFYLWFDFDIGFNFYFLKNGVEVVDVLVGSSISVSNKIWKTKEAKNRGGMLPLPNE